MQVPNSAILVNCANRLEKKSRKRIKTEEAGSDSDGDAKLVVNEYDQEDDDAEYYREEVGQEPDEGRFCTSLLALCSPCWYATCWVCQKCWGSSNGFGSLRDFSRTRNKFAGFVLGSDIDVGREFRGLDCKSR